MIFLYLIFVFLFGAVIGSFLNVMILRNHIGKSLGGRSVCPHCHHQLATVDLIPIISYILLAGKCRYCGHKLSVQYPLVELTTGILFTLIFLSSQTVFGCQTLTYECLTPVSLSALVLGFFIISVLIVITVTDLRWGIIPDKIILPASLVVFSLKSFQFLISTSQVSQDFIFDLIAAAGIGLFFFLLIFGTRGKGMGGGDLKLSIFIGLALGFPMAILAIFLGFLTGAIGAVMLILLGKKSVKQTVPFGPFLALGTYLALVFGNQILDLYLTSIGF